MTVDGAKTECVSHDKCLGFSEADGTVFMYHEKYKPISGIDASWTAMASSNGGTGEITSGSTNGGGHTCYKKSAWSLDLVSSTTSYTTNTIACTGGHSHLFCMVERVRERKKEREREREKKKNIKKIEKIK